MDSMPGTGKELWQVEQQVPRLSLRGTAVPVIAKEVAISGFDNGKVMAVSLANGDTVWDTALASPHGRTELDRLVDIDSAVRVVGDDVFATGFQGRTAMLALDSGQIWWAHDMSSYRGLCADADNLFVTESDGEVIALRERDGSEIWRNSSIRRRALTAPVETTTAVVVGDYQGYLHWLDKGTGYLVARERVSKYRVSNQPVADGDTVIVLDDGGKLAAYRADPAKALPPHPDPVPPPPKPEKKKKEKPADLRRNSRRHVMLPVVALIGRPNVGKSTLFNAMTGTRDALVADLPGLTRDRQYGFARRTDVPCIVVDTGGLVENAEGIESLMIAQTERAMAEADRLIVLVDGRAGLTPQDQFVAQLARRSGKPVWLAVNKTEGFDHDVAVGGLPSAGSGRAASHRRRARSGRDLAARGGSRKASRPTRRTAPRRPASRLP